MAKVKSLFVCNNCGADSPKWVGKCSICGEWNTYHEEIIRTDTAKKTIRIRFSCAKIQACIAFRG